MPYHIQNQLQPGIKTQFERQKYSIFEVYLKDILCARERFHKKQTKGQNIKKLLKDLPTIKLGTLFIKYHRVKR